MKRTLSLVLILIFLCICIGGCAEPTYVVAHGQDVPQNQLDDGRAYVTDYSVQSEGTKSSSENLEQEISKAYNNGHYLDVIRMYEAALSEPSLFITETMQDQYYDSFTKYVDAALEKAQIALGEEHNYDEAIAILESYMRKAAGINEIMSLLNEAKNDYIMMKYERLMEESFLSEQYLQVIRLYEEALDNCVTISENMDLLYEESLSNYMLEVSHKAAVAFGDDKDYNAAVQPIREALAEVKDIDRLVYYFENLLAEYVSYTPIPLTSLQYTQKATHIELPDQYTDKNILKDVNGVLYSRDSVIYRKYPETNSKQEAYIQYNLNYEYSTLSGTVYRPYDSFSCTVSWDDSPGKVLIYGDDQLLYESPGITLNTYDTYSFSLDVSGVRNLKIVMRGAWAIWNDWGIRECHHPMACLGNLMLQK